MAYGGGSWDSQNKKMPGDYMNFVSGIVPKADNYSNRGKNDKIKWLVQLTVEIAVSFGSGCVLTFDVVGN